jgi:RNA polymerase sigma-70 factor (ECF subfamily)
MESTYLWCYRRTENTHDAEDLSQEILLEAIVSYRKACEKGTPPVAFYAWYWSLAQNRLHLFYRFRRKQAILLGESIGNLSDKEPGYFDLQDIDEAIMAEDERRELTYQLSMLSRIQRECVILYYLQQRSVKEIADILEIPEGTVKTRLFDARKTLKKGMENSMSTKNNASYESKNKRLSYAPAELDMCGGGMITKHWDFLNDLMVEQIITVCAYEGKTMRQISEAIGVAPIYFEEKIRYLLEHKFLKETSPGTYIDDFCVFPQQAWLDYCVDKSRICTGRMAEVAATVRSMIPDIRQYIINETDFSDGYLTWFLYPLAAEAMEMVMLRHYRKDSPHDVLNGNGKDWRLFVKVQYPNENPTMKGECKTVSWSNLHSNYRTSNGRFTVANLYQALPFSDRDHIVTENNADLLMRLYRDPHIELNEFEREKAANLVSKGLLFPRDGGLFLNVPILSVSDKGNIVLQFSEALDRLSSELVAPLVRVSDENLLPHIRPELMEEYINGVMSVSFFCVSELFWYAFHEGNDLEIPEDYEQSAAGMALYLL